jgi:DNA-binding MarR family transcriptional regulator
VASTKRAERPPAVIDDVREWVQGGRDQAGRMDGDGLERYFHGVAEARYVIRRVFRIVDEQAKAADLEPLEHQALIQILGAPKPFRVIDLADRLDIAPAFASRLAKRLEDSGLVQRSAALDDRRSKHLAATERARELLAQIDEQVHVHVDYFQRQLSHDERVAALGIFAFYLGAAPDTAELDAIVKR